MVIKLLWIFCALCAQTPSQVLADSTLSEQFERYKGMWRRHDCKFPDPSTYEDKSVQDVLGNVGDAAQAFSPSDFATTAEVLLNPCQNDISLSSSYPDDDEQFFTIQLCMAVFSLSRVLCQRNDTEGTPSTEKPCDVLTKMKPSNLDFLTSSSDTCREQCEENRRLGPICRLLVSALRPVGNSHQAARKVYSQRKPETNDDGHRTTRRQQEDAKEDPNKREDRHENGASKNTPGDKGRYKESSTNDQEADVGSPAYQIEDQSDGEEPQDDNALEPSSQVGEDGGAFGSTPQDDDGEGKINVETNEKAKSEKSSKELNNGKNNDETTKKSSVEIKNEKISGDAKNGKNIDGTKHEKFDVNEMDRGKDSDNIKNEKSKDKKEKEKDSDDTTNANSNEETNNGNIHFKTTNDKKNADAAKKKSSEEVKNEKSNGEPKNVKKDDDPINDKSSEGMKDGKNGDNKTDEDNEKGKIHDKTNQNPSDQTEKDETNDDGTSVENVEKGDPKDENLNAKSTNDETNGKMKTAKKTNGEKTEGEENRDGKTADDLDFPEAEKKVSEKKEIKQPGIPPDGVMKLQKLPEESEKATGHFMAYFMAAVVLCIAGYVIFHNRQRAIAFLLEGRREAKRRREASSDRGAKYTEVHTSVEDAMPSLDKSTTFKNFVY